MFEDNANHSVIGHIHIEDITNQCAKFTILDKDNSIHYENFSLALAQSLGRTSSSGIYSGPIYKMLFGNGATSVNGVGDITYLPKNTIGQNATLYNTTYSKIIDSNNTLNVDTSRNYVSVSHVAGNTYSDILSVCTLEYSEPSTQEVLDSSATLNNSFAFDEIGLQNYDGKLLTHVTFAPTIKSFSRAFEIQYTIRIQMV